MKLYLAAPYSHDNPEVCEYRFCQANRAAAKLMQAGHVVFSPISHSHPVSKHLGNSLDLDFWLEQDRAFLNWADEMWVLMLPGWEQSAGIRWEIDYAFQAGKRVMFWDGESIKKANNNKVEGANT